MKTRCISGLRLAAIATLLCGVLGNFCSGQEAPPESLTASRTRYQAIFTDVEVGISTGSVAILAKYFAPQVALNLRSGENGTFSANQSYYVLQDFFKLRRFSRFAFSTIGESDANPYASGNVELTFKGTKELVQVYVALTLAGDRYVMTQLTVY